MGRHPTYIRNTTALLRSSCVCTDAFLSSSAGLAATGFVLRLVASVACCWFLAACKARALHLGSGSTWLEQYSTVGTQLYLHSSHPCLRVMAAADLSTTTLLEELFQTLFVDMACSQHPRSSTLKQVSFSSSGRHTSLNPARRCWRPSQAAYLPT